MMSEVIEERHVGRLREVEEGEYGWVYSKEGDRGRLLFYDDDHTECSCGNQSCYEYCDEENDCYRETGAHLPAHYAICYEHPNDLGMPGRGYWLLNIEDLYYIGGRPEAVGMIYAVLLAPEMPRRIKVGFTAKPIEHRLQSFRTTNPDAELIGLWGGFKQDERTVHYALDGRVGRSEVFDVRDVNAALHRIQGILESDADAPEPTVRAPIVLPEIKPPKPAPAVVRKPPSNDNAGKFFWRGRWRTA